MYGSLWKNEMLKSVVYPSAERGVVCVLASCRLLDGLSARLVLENQAKIFVISKTQFVYPTAKLTHSITIFRWTKMTFVLFFHDIRHI